MSETKNESCKSDLDRPTDFEWTGSTAPTTTSVVCYFQKGTTVRWQWGLAGDNSYYVLRGWWKKTIYSGIQKFFTGTDRNPIIGAALKAQSYYGLGDWTLLGVFAADSGVGFNYPIVAAGTDLDPNLIPPDTGLADLRRSA